MEARLLQRLAHGSGVDLFAGLDAAARRPPDAVLEVRLADQCEPVAVDDEERHVVRPRGVVRRETPLPLADLARPAHEGRLAVALPDAGERRLVDVDQSLRRSRRNSPVLPTTISADSRSTEGDSAETTATRTAQGSPSIARKASRSVVSSPATSARDSPRL